MSERDELVKRLRSKANDLLNVKGETMARWDQIRRQVETLPGSDLPRLNFEGLLEDLAELLVEAAEEIDPSMLHNVAALRAERAGEWRPPEGDYIKDGIQALREIEVGWLCDTLAGSIANLGYPVGCGQAPKPEHLRKAAENLFERYAKMIELAALRARPEAAPGWRLVPEDELRHPRIRQAWRDYYAALNDCWTPCACLENEQGPSCACQADERIRTLLAASPSPPAETWRTMESAPKDDAFRFYGLHVKNRRGLQWFEVYYLQRDTVTGDMLETSGDIFLAWSFDDFEVWCDGPQPPPSPPAAQSGD